MTAAERLLRYVQFDTQSNEFSETCPSTDKQKVLGLSLVEEMKAMGISDAYMDAEGYVYGTVPGAVSYTHLDVYKRQAVHRFRLPHESHGAPGFVPGLQALHHPTEDSLGPHGCRLRVLLFLPGVCV